MRREIGNRLAEWYAVHARRLPWREAEPGRDRPDPYRVWISEIMLQQTRVEAVRDYYRRFLGRLPDVGSLAAVPEDELMKLWQGLGYYNRARNLQKAACVIRDEHNGRFPDQYEVLLTLPGIGEYTAGAIASIAFGQEVPAVDGNVYRIYSRLMEDDSDITRTATRRRVWQEVQSIIPPGQAGQVNQAWMDLGATICLPNGQPHCEQCPLRQDCLAGQHGSWMDYPVKPQKKQRQIQDRTVFLLECEGQYLLQKRPPRGLLAGLWEFPSQEGRLEPEQVGRYLAQWNLADTQIELLGAARHIFSHVEWHMTGYRIHLPQIPPALREGNGDGTSGRWVTPEEMEEQYSIPTAFRAYYEKIGGESCITEQSK